MTTHAYWIALIAACAIGGCNRNEPTAAAPTPEPAKTMSATTPPAAPPTETEKPAAKLLEDPGANSGTPVSRAIAVLTPMKGSKVEGTIEFTSQDNGGVQVKADVTGLPPKSTHAFHVHVFGDCSGDDGKTAGTHFNFMGSSENPGEHIDRITGNLGELTAGADGKASVTATIEKGSLQGQYSILGRSVVVHEKGNDPKSPPMGAAGGRLACGVIGIADSAPQKAAAPTKPAKHMGG
jgi:Cu-Zn family superoxide dismutase